MARNPFLQLRGDQPITDPSSGLPTQYFLEMMFSTVDNAEDTADGLGSAVPNSRAITAGEGLSGGGDLTEDRTIALDASLDDLNDVDFSTPPTDQQVMVFDEASGLWIPADQSGGGGGGGGGTTPTVRSSSTVTGYESSYNIAWPTGTAEGDVVVIFGGHAYQINTPAGWSLIGTRSDQGFHNGTIIAKVMTSADITAGSVTVATTGSYYGVFHAVTLDSSASNFFFSTSGAAFSSSGTTSTSVVVPKVKPTDLCLVFATTRGDVTCTITNASATTIESYSGTEASGVVASVVGQAGPLGLPATGSFSSAGSGYYFGVVVFEGV